MNPHQILEISPLRPFVLQITWRSGKITEVDVTESIRKSPCYSPLENQELFMQATVAEWGWGVTWPGDIEMAADRLYQMTREQAGKAFPSASFRKWMTRNGLTLTTAAEALGITRRTVVSYSSGQRPIPIYIGLACDGYEARLHSSRKKAA